MTSASKTFSIAGTRLGAVIIDDETLRRDSSPSHGRATDLYPEPSRRRSVARGVLARRGCLGRRADALPGRKLRGCFATAMTAIPGAAMHQLEGTYLAWVDFSGTGMSDAELWTPA